MFYACIGGVGVVYGNARGNVFVYKIFVVRLGRVVGFESSAAGVRCARCRSTSFLVVVLGRGCLLCSAIDFLLWS